MAQRYQQSALAVDYLTYRWTPEEVHHCYRGVSRELAKNARESVVETHKLERLQNAAWRQYARLFKQLGGDNALVHPELLNWQKDYDITWLHGRYYEPPSAIHALTIDDDLTLPSSPAAALSTSSSTSSSATSAASPTSIPSPVSPPSHCHCTNPKSGALKPVLKHSAGIAPWQQKCGAAKKSLRFDPEIKRVEYGPGSPIVRGLERSESKEMELEAIDVDVEMETTGGMAGLFGMEDEDSFEGPSVEEVKNFMLELPRSRFFSSHLGEDRTKKPFGQPTQLQHRHRPPPQPAASLLDRAVGLAANVRDVMTWCSAVVAYSNVF
ncbi:uncharacterized protein VTP21DRAFT_6225 [Calcarisporiella thermophila]|uniref:uncharacterized protein n=1 Tax=Calcarisporiella thermophila TaxID=911321 RepID=UPI0037441F98